MTAAKDKAINAANKKYLLKEKKEAMTALKEAESLSKKAGKRL